MNNYIKANKSDSLVPAFMTKNYLFYFISFSIFVLFKFIFRSCSSLNFLIAPVDKIVSIATNSDSIFIAPDGYYHEKLNIIINKSCSGFNFWLMSFFLMSFLISKYINDRKYCYAALPLIFLISYLLTVLVNALRIIYFVNTQSLKKILHLTDYSWLHQAEGAFIYLLSLIFIYMTLNYFLNKITGENDAKLTQP